VPGVLSDFHVRAPTREDAEAVTELVIAFDVDEFGSPDFELDDLLADWGSPGLDLERDARLVETNDGHLAAYGVLYFDNDADVYVRPEFQGRGIGTGLLDLVERRALEGAEGGEVLLGQALSSVNTAGRDLLTRAGYRPVRTYWRFVLPLEEAPAEPTWPDGVRMRAFDPERDGKAVHSLIQTAFADNERYREVPYSEWVAGNIDREAFDPELWILAVADGEVVGSIVCPNYESEGWVRQLAVARDWRGRGVGMALLLKAFGEFYRRGRPHVALVVDSWNRTGARGLYERAGMRVEREHARFEKTLQASS
jgi:mycothiol synthase